MSETKQLFSLETLALIPWWTCDIKCDHCLFSSSPEVRGCLALREAERVICETAICSTVRRVTVSGGEPFLDVPYLLHIAEVVSANKLQLRVVTNASFADTFAGAKQKLGAIQKFGLEALCISWDAFHAEFVSPDKIRTAIRAARELGITVRLTAVVTKSKRLDDVLAPLGPEAFDLPITQIACLPVGRAITTVPQAEFPIVSDCYRDRACKSDFDTLAIVHDGSVYPCCAVGGFTKGIRLGSVHEEPIANLLHRRDFDLKWVILASRGPNYFLANASREEAQTLAINDDMHDCVKCNRLFKSELGRAIVARSVEKLRGLSSGLLTSGSLNLQEEL